MGLGMCKILPGLYVGSYRDVHDNNQLKKNGITHILAVHDNSRPLHDHMVYKCIECMDTPQQDISQHFRECINFIHRSRINDGSVLVHCLAGVSRSVTIVLAYLITVTDMKWEDALKAVRASRTQANPNLGFRRQLQIYTETMLAETKKELRESYPDYEPTNDSKELDILLEKGKNMKQYMDDDDRVFTFPIDAYKND
ncbi:uncharacterized protein TRIADDRAFT_60150 [Trichoplax adhaerens]|uniref:Dual specificity protein phosphatase 15 n=1 Tax=Trichoplax adhaerens TaxID=10228 RepID=B3S7F8_TRIAD|nr:hypothetical protein TRIADDRAFT_60150 [Trichoplax adhaerens]EDV21192.1 hypothetical protein TRIADDRAFT_60150 [Trichoplax adhaerens]|eukprot:XP_002116159.1 hypothetical protein TRIADDRAFT_60150 [Trichoplax adhaerens]